MDIIRFGRPNSRPPLLFVHGSYCGPWVWQKYFLPAFARARWWGAAIALRGHGRQEDPRQVDNYGLREFLEDLETGGNLFERPPIFIGHSLGGYLVQKYALSHAVRAMALLAAPSLLGLGNSALHIALHHPALAVELSRLMALGPRHADTRVIGEAFLGNSQTAEALSGMEALLQRESQRVAFEASWPELWPPTRFVPTLVLGGEQDAFVPATELRFEAFCWQARLEILPGVPHALMLAPCWPEVVDTMLDWLKTV